MSGRSDNALEGGIGGAGNWLLGGAIGGAIGSLTFGLLLWLVDPAIITEAVPAVYGLEPIGTAGWIFHLVHGLVLGVVFGFLVTREPVLGTLTADVETGFLAAMGPGVRVVLAGFVYGLALWTILPLIAAPLLASIAGGEGSEFPAFAIEGLLGHVLYGLVLGALFALLTDLEPDADAAEAPFREASDGADSAPEPREGDRYRRYSSNSTRGTNGPKSAVRLAIDAMRNV